MNSFALDQQIESEGARTISRGYTKSDETTFPVSVGPDLSHNEGYYDAYIAKIAFALTADRLKLPASIGGTVGFHLQSSAGNANRTYLLLGGMSGPHPGYPLPGGLATLPLSWDDFTDQLLLLVNTPACEDFIGTLNEIGYASAQLQLNRLRPEQIGLEFNFAYCLNEPFDFASNSMMIEIVP